MSSGHHSESELQQTQSSQTRPENSRSPHCRWEAGVNKEPGEEELLTWSQHVATLQKNNPNSRVKLSQTHSIGCFTFYF